MSRPSDDQPHAAASARGVPQRAPLGWRRIAAHGLAGWALAALVSMAHGQSAPQPLLMVEQGTHSAPVRRIDVDASRGLAVTASDDRTARVWDVASGELRHILRPLAFGDEGGRLYGAALHPSRPVVAVGGTTGGDGHAHAIYLFDVETGALLRRVDAGRGHVRKLVWSSDGTVLLAAFAGEHGVKAFSFDGAPLFELSMPAPVFGLAVSSHGLAAAAALDGSVRTFRVGAGAVAPLLSLSMGARRAAGLTFSPDGARLAIAYADTTVGANGRESLHEAVEVIDAASGRSLSRLAVVPMFGGDLRVVAWSADGRSIHAAGTAYDREFGFPIVQYDVASGRAIAVTNVARDSVTDLVALPDGALAFSSFDGSWGILRGARVAPRVAPTVTVVRGGVPEDLELSDDARSVRWGVRSTAAGKGFEFGRRQPGLQPVQPVRAPETTFSVFNRPSDWNLSRSTPIVGGRPLALAPDERSRALAVVRATKSALIGTNRALYKLDDQGRLQWRSAVDTEVRALNASEDGRWVVAAMADGTVRWFRGRDGTQQLTLLLDAEGRWVVWTAGGYFDASAGADRLVGWALANGPSKAMDFYSINRFRDRFNRPDLIDALLDTQDEALALASVAARDAAAQELARATRRRRCASGRRARRVPPKKRCWHVARPSGATRKRAWRCSVRRRRLPTRLRPRAKPKPDASRRAPPSARRPNARQRPGRPRRDRPPSGRRPTSAWRSKPSAPPPRSWRNSRRRHDRPRRAKRRPRWRRPKPRRAKRP